MSYKPIEDLEKIPLTPRDASTVYYEDENAVIENTVDGNYISSPLGQCYHSGEMPSFALYEMPLSTVTEVKILNRGDCCGENTFLIFIFS